MTAYYNEFDPYAAQWLRNLIEAGHIAPGDVDERDIREVQADDLSGYTQCHFFAGIGGWSLALRIAGWPDDRPVWTGSCPCQPFAEAPRGKQKGFDDDRHLWPEFDRLIGKRRPSTVFGEQIATQSALGWLDRVAADLERKAYTFGAHVLCASTANVPKRRRIYFVADSDSQGQRPSAEYAEVAGLCSPTRVDSHDWRFLRDVGSDGDGLPARMDRLRAYGNAIVPQVAAQFVSAAMECLECSDAQV